MRTSIHLPSSKTGQRCRVAGLALRQQHPATNAQSAFTMVEIAMAVGVIAFALVAIIGILPYGMNVQKDNREDTIISQDAPFFLEAIRNGAVPSLSATPPNHSMDFLTNYVESITIITNIATGGAVVYTNAPTSPTFLENGVTILGLLSTPKIYPSLPGQTNLVSAVIRGLSGSAAEVGVSNSLVAFKYAMAVEIAPFNSIAPDSINYQAYLLSPNTNDWITRSNRFSQAHYLPFNLFEVRLTFSWPILPNGNVGPNHQTYRSVISSPLLPYNGGPLWFFKPQIFTNAAAT
jgi:type II secretory pathway pseudopilin PulG